MEIFLPAVVGDIEKLEMYFRRDYFDVVICNDVIEHLMDPDSFIAGVKHCLKSTGVLVITTPNLASIFNRFALLLGYTPFNYSPSTKYRVDTLFSNLPYSAGHKSVFTVKGMKELLRIHGFDMILATGFSYGGKIIPGSGGGYKNLRLFIDKLVPTTLSEGMLLFAKKISFKNEDK